MTTCLAIKQNKTFHISEMIILFCVEYVTSAYHPHYASKLRTLRYAQQIFFAESYDLIEPGTRRFDTNSVGVFVFTCIRSP